MPPIRLILLLAASLLLPAALAAPRPQSYTTKVSRCFNRDACQEITLERLNTNNPSSTAGQTVSSKKFGKSLR